MVNFFDHWPWGKFQGVMVMVSALPPPPPPETQQSGIPWGVSRGTQKELEVWMYENLEVSKSPAVFQLNLYSISATIAIQRNTKV